MSNTTLKDLRKGSKLLQRKLVILLFVVFFPSIALIGVFTSYWPVEDRYPIIFVFCSMIIGWAIIVISRKMSKAVNCVKCGYNLTSVIEELDNAGEIHCPSCGETYS